jgi:uncharacterized membrane protein
MAPTPPQRHRFDRLAAELAELSDRLDQARAELLSWPATPEPTTRPPVPDPSTGTPEPGTPEPDGPESDAPPPGPAVGAATPEPGRARRDVAVLVWAGGAITLVGVVMFLLLAASRGMLAIPVRLGLGALLGLVLVGFGARRNNARDGGIGAPALAATGFAVLYLDLGAATAMYEYLPTPVGLGVGLLITGSGLALADRWRSQPLAVGVVLGIGSLLPALTRDSPPLLVALVLLPQLASAPVVLRRAWGWLAVVASAFPLLYGASLVMNTLLWSSLGLGTRADAVLASVAVLVVGAGVAVTTARVLDPVVGALRVVAAPAPALGVAVACAPRPGALLAGGVALVLLLPAAAVALARRRCWAGRFAVAQRLIPDAMVVGFLVAGAVAAFEATVLLLHGGALTAVLLGQAVALAVLAGIGRRRAVLALSCGYGATGLVPSLVRDAPLRALVEFPTRPYFTLPDNWVPYRHWSATEVGPPDHSAILLGLSLSVLVLLLAARVLIAGHTISEAGKSSWSVWFWAPVGAVGLYGAAGTVITSALLLAPSLAGFVGGHAVVTISWTLLGLALLAPGIRLPVPRITGLVLIASAIGKLVLFDLVTLDGLARVAAFVGAGLLLLAAGGRYARLVARSPR